MLRNLLQKTRPAKRNYIWPSLREEGTQHATKLQLSVRMRNIVHIEDMSVSFLNAVITDFKLQINNLFATVHNKLPRHSKVRNIAL